MCTVCVRGQNKQAVIKDKNVLPCADIQNKELNGRIYETCYQDDVRADKDWFLCEEVKRRSSHFSWSISDGELASEVSIIKEKKRTTASVSSNVSHSMELRRKHEQQRQYD